MLFHSTEFVLGFLPACLAGYFLLGRYVGDRSALLWLIAASLFFYGWWNPAYLPLLCGSVLMNFTIASYIHRSAHKRAWLVVGVTLNLGLLGWFKYADFLLHIVAPTAPGLHITLPLAISFFTFQQIMLLVDAAQAPDRRATAELAPYGAFVTFFPHLIAGPIVRPSEIIPQFLERGVATPNRDNLTDGLVIFLLGLGKKLVLADMFGGFADIGFGAARDGVDLSFFEAWYATLAYALQIYFDFSGYSDMAIGLARMLNIRFPMNFDSPYRSGNIAEFWRRWHMTLGAFLRDYLFIPLGGSRMGERRRVSNLILTMLLAGLWHGAAWNFVVWGGLHGTYLVTHAQYRRWFPPLPLLLGQTLTLLAVVLAWVPFRASGYADAMAMLRGMLGLNGIVLPRMIVETFPSLSGWVGPVGIMPFLGDSRTLSFPEVSACLLLGWVIVLALPNVQRMTERSRPWALASGFALTIQELLFAPHVAPFLYFQF